MAKTTQRSLSLKRLTWLAIMWLQRKDKKKDKNEQKVVQAYLAFVQRHKDEDLGFDN